MRRITNKSSSENGVPYSADDVDSMSELEIVEDKLMILITNVISKMVGRWAKTILVSVAMMAAGGATSWAGIKSDIKELKDWKDTRVIAIYEYDVYRKKEAEDRATIKQQVSEALSLAREDHAMLIRYLENRKQDK